MDIIQLKWSVVIGQIRLSMWQIRLYLTLYISHYIIHVKTLTNGSIEILNSCSNGRLKLQDIEAIIKRLQKTYYNK